MILTHQDHAAIVKATTTSAWIMSKIAPRSPSQLSAAVSIQDAEPIAKRRGKNRGRTPEEVEYQGRVVELGCMVCKLMGVEQESHTELHHHRAGRLRSDCHYDVLPLCSNRHHRGKTGWHGSRDDFKAMSLTPEYLLEKVKELLDN